MRNYFQITFKAIHPAESAAILIIALRAWVPAQEPFFPLFLYSWSVEGVWGRGVGNLEEREQKRALS